MICRIQLRVRVRPARQAEENIPEQVNKYSATDKHMCNFLVPIDTGHGAGMLCYDSCCTVPYELV